MSRTYRKTAKTRHKLPQSNGAVKRKVDKGLYGKETKRVLKGDYTYTVVTDSKEDHVLGLVDYFNQNNIVPVREHISGSKETRTYEFKTRTIVRTLDKRVYGFRVKLKVIKKFKKQNVFHKSWIVKKDSDNVYLSDKLFTVKKTLETEFVFEKVNHSPDNYKCKCGWCRAGRTANSRRRLMGSQQSLKDADVHASKIKRRKLNGEDKFYD